MTPQESIQEIEPTAIEAISPWGKSQTFEENETDLVVKPQHNLNSPVTFLHPTMVNNEKPVSIPGIESRPLVLPKPYEYRSPKKVNKPYLLTQKEKLLEKIHIQNELLRVVKAKAQQK